MTWAQEHTAIPDVMGVNYYPCCLDGAVRPPACTTSGGPATSAPRVNAWTDGLAEVLTAFAERYGRPVLLTETCGRPVRRGPHPLAGRVRRHACASCAIRGRVVGYTWWAVIDMMEWTYRHGNSAPMAYHLTMGLWSLVEDGAGVLRRVKTPVADRFRDHATDPRNAEVDLEEAS